MGSPKTKLKPNSLLQNGTNTLAVTFLAEKGLRAMTAHIRTNRRAHFPVSRSFPSSILSCPDTSELYPGHRDVVHGGALLLECPNPGCNSKTYYLSSSKRHRERCKFGRQGS